MAFLGSAWSKGVEEETKVKTKTCQHNSTMTSEKGLRVFLGSLILLVVSLFIYYIRYPMWQYFSFIEPIFALELISYFIVFTIALLLLKKDSRKSLSSVLKNKRSLMVILGLLFALLYLGLWYLISFGLGSKIEFGSFPSLRGFENYTVYSLSLAFGMSCIRAK